MHVEHKPDEWLSIRGLKAATFWRLFDDRISVAISTSVAVTMIYGDLPPKPNNSVTYDVPFYFGSSATLLYLSNFIFLTRVSFLITVITER